MKRGLLLVLVLLAMPLVVAGVTDDTSYSIFYADSEGGGNNGSYTVNLSLYDTYRSGNLLETTELSKAFVFGWTSVKLDTTQRYTYPTYLGVTIDGNLGAYRMNISSAPMAIYANNSLNLNNRSSDYFLNQSGYTPYFLNATIGDFGKVESDYYVNATAGKFGNVTVNQYIYSKDLNGSLGSGIIWADKYDANGDVNVTHVGGSGLNLTYPDMLVRLVTTGGDVEHCHIPGAPITVTDDQHTVYYVSSACTVTGTPFSTYITTALSPGGLTDLFSTVAHGSDIELHKGATVQNKAIIQARKAAIYLGHLKVASGLDVTTEGFPGFSTTVGKYLYDRTVVDASAQNVSLGQGIDVIYKDAGAWVYNNQTGMNLTHCHDGTDLAKCTGSLYRRYLLFLIGYDNVEDETKVHELLPLEAETYANLASCTDIEADPISYTLPALYDDSAVPLKMYCGRRIDTSWSGAFIDLRSGAGGVGAAPDTSIFLTKDGSRSLTGNWNTGIYNINISKLDVFWYLNFSAGDFVIDNGNLEISSGFVNASLFEGDGSNLWGVWNTTSDILTASGAYNGTLLKSEYFTNGTLLRSEFWTNRTVLPSQLFTNKTIGTTNNATAVSFTQVIASRDINITTSGEKFCFSSYWCQWYNGSHILESF